MKSIQIISVIFLFFLSEGIMALGKTTSCFQLISGTVRNKTSNKIIKDATVTLYANNVLVETLQTNSKGSFRLKVACNTSYELVSFKGNFTKTKKNFVTSNNGNINVEFSMYIEEKQECKITVKGIIKNDENEFIKESVIIIYDKGKEVNRAIVKSDGKYEFSLKCNKPYKIVAQSEDHIESGILLNTGTKNKKIIEKNFSLQKLACIKDLFGSVTSLKSNIKLANASINLLLDGKIIKSIKTDTQGKFNFKVNCGGNYTVTASKTDYQKSTFRVTKIKYVQENYFLNIQISPLIKENIIEEEIVVAKEIVNIKTTIGEDIINKTKQNTSQLEVGKIDFDLNEYKITRNIANELDKIIVFMIKKSTANLLLKSHTDSRGPDIYNYNLTQKRAQSMTNYIVSNGIDPNRVLGKGYGETELVNNCSNGIKCTETEHQKNRRNEFIITNE